MSGRNKYDSGASAETQANIKKLSAQIESLIAQHKANVANLKSHNHMTDVMGQYSAVEDKFNTAADDVHTIIVSLAQTLAKFDAAADTAFQAATKAVQGIGNT